LSATKEGNAGSVAMVLASILFEMYQQGVRIHETFLFDPALETLGKWYRQLLAESVGKQQENGTRVGIMPTIAIGSVDLHSLGQLVFGGPRDRFTTFVSCPATFRQVLPLERESPFTHRTLEGVHAGQVMEAIYEGVKVAYTKHNLPYISIEFSSLDARELGACMTLQMTTVMYLASLLSVNAFDQPNVEAYKHEARKRLVGE
jgi:glucose-6-phosphate isomerase